MGRVTTSNPNKRYRISMKNIYRTISRIINSSEYWIWLAILAAIKTLFAGPTVIGLIVVIMFIGIYYLSEIAITLNKMKD